MRPKRFTKRYETPKECAAAWFHHRWLSAYAQPLHLPRIVILDEVELSDDQLRRLEGLGQLVRHTSNPADEDEVVRRLDGAEPRRLRPSGYPGSRRT
jgi:hypothetical protein